MQQFFGYIRVSTAKQGEKGVSLQEQRDAIARYAAHFNLGIADWFEERQTAAKHGRPVFNRMLKLLRAGKAGGVIIHKIDRSARNLRDWASLGELIDQGIDVRFANESLDLHSRGGRLSADIQAVVAADYIRNLKEETRKGFYGRLKQGLYPLPAPLGCLDCGGGKAKEIDPVKGPLVRKAFELYATGRYNLDSLVAELFRLGLRNRTGGKVGRSSFSVILNNSFYIGLIHLKRTGETFSGIHPPLISKALFDCVQRVLSGRWNTRSLRHDFLFRRLFTCQECRYSLVGERQKGHIYYRCHTKDCPTTGIREDAIETEIKVGLSALQFSEDERRYFRAKIAQMKEEWGKKQEYETTGLNLRLDQLSARLNRLTDAFLDGSIDKLMFEERKTALLLERRGLEETLASLKGKKQNLPERLEKFLELAGNALLSYEKALSDEKRDLVKILTSNRVVNGKNLYLRLSIPFNEVEKRFQNSYGPPFRDIPRTWEALFAKLKLFFSTNHAPEWDLGDRDAASVAE